MQGMFVQSLYFDIADMYKTVAPEEPLLTYVDYMNELLTEIQYHLTYVRIAESRLINVQIHTKHTLVLEFMRQ